MADVVMLPLTGSAVAAARLINFPTGHANLLPTHVAWLDNIVAPLLKMIDDPWVDLFGYASHLGSAAFNKKLSFDRCESVRGENRQLWLESFVPRGSRVRRGREHGQRAGQLGGLARGRRRRAALEADPQAAAAAESLQAQGAAAFPFGGDTESAGIHRTGECAKGLRPVRHPARIRLWAQHGRVDHRPRQSRRFGRHVPVEPRHRTSRSCSMCSAAAAASA